VFMGFMKSKGIAVDIHYPILDCDQAAWRTLPMRIDEKSQLQISKSTVGHVVSLPCFPLLQEQEVDQVCQALSEWEHI
jgi:dTDP-4-amino-4,6-dideoxygalactose transaminase